MKKGNLWSIILAGGEGDRISPLIPKWLGHHKPKQYCTFVGHRSMFQRTLDRADQVLLPDYRVTVIAQSHKFEVERQFGDRRIGRISCIPLWKSAAATSDNFGLC